MNNRLLSILFIFTISIGYGQSSIDSALTLISKNNKHIKSAVHFVTMKQLDNRSGLTLENPTISADYMIGRPVSGGNQLDFLAVQGFEFPTVYAKKGALADQQNLLLEMELIELRQNVLLEAKLVILEIIALNKQREILQERTNKAQRIVDDYQKRYSVGDTTVLVLNKSKIHLLSHKSRARRLASEITIKSEHLAELNGGIPIEVNSNTFPLVPNVEPFEQLEAQIEQHDPALKALHQQSSISESQLALSKAVALPNFELGYHYQSVLGQQFNGAHLGITIPILEHKNRVKTERFRVELTKIKINEHETEHYYEIKELYHSYENLKVELNEYTTALEGLNSEVLLKTALDLGEISFINYVLDLNYYYDAYDELSSIERDYHIAIAKLYKYQL
ncbi:MAG: cobalt-zinc-cadmium efflux system outer membrane protein [Crocinitomicaceae bacterium]|jgi:cobalt-zinc-cadmium efflux system outer membrane protein